MPANERISLAKTLTSDDLERIASSCQKQLTDEAMYYLESRRIYPKTIEQFGIGFQSAKIGFAAESNSIADYFENRIVIPVRNGEGKITELVGRAIDQREPKYKLLLGNEEAFFNETELDESDEVILCNNIFDTLILIQEDLPAICLQTSVSFKAVHAQRLIGKRVLICLGNDETGLRESARIENLLRELDIETYIVHLPENIRDINDMFVNFEEPLARFLDLLNATIEQAMLEPIASDFRNIIVFNEEYMKRFRGLVSGVSSGLESLDRALLGGFRSGLYIITGTTASGKTLLMKQMADHIASGQTPVIYVSYDLTAFELWARSIARILGKATHEVLNGNLVPESVFEANQTYHQLSQSMWTLEMPFDSSIQYALAQVEKILLTLGRPPVVFIDNLQRIPYSRRDGEVQSAAQFQAMMAYRFKELSREWQCPFICSIPAERQEHPLPIGVEAAADVIMELRRESDKHTTAGRDAQSTMSLTLLKHRNGALGTLQLNCNHSRTLFTAAP